MFNHRKIANCFQQVHIYYMASSYTWILLMRNALISEEKLFTINVEICPQPVRCHEYGNSYNYFVFSLFHVRRMYVAILECPRDIVLAFNT